MNLRNSLAGGGSGWRATGAGGPEASQCTGCDLQQHTVRGEMTGQAEGCLCQLILPLPRQIAQGGSGVHEFKG